jgi:ribosomal protein S6--L-glutamate ligase
MESSNKLHILILTNSSQKKLIEVIENRGHTYELLNPSDLYLFVSESENGYDRIYNGNADLLTPQRLKAKDYDCVISRIGKNLNHGASILRHLTENLGIYCPQSADGLLTSSDKLKTTQRLSFKGIRVPATIYAANPLHIDFLLSKVGGLPAVAKMLHGSQGVGVSILETPLATNTALESYCKAGIDIKIQAFIKAGGKDVRAIVVGNKVVSAMERTANKGDFRANISKQGSGKKIDLSNEDEEICVNTSKALGLEFSGVDIMKDENGKTYVIENNGNPGTQICNITGHNYFEDLLDLIEDKTGVSENTSSNSNEKQDANIQIVKEVKVESINKISASTQYAIEARNRVLSTLAKNGK